MAEDDNYFGQQNCFDDCDGTDDDGGDCNFLYDVETCRRRRTISLTAETCSDNFVEILI